MVALSDHIPAWAIPDRYIARAQSTDHVTIVVDLGLSRSDAIAVLAQELTDPASSRYRQYLSPQQFSHLFSPTRGQARLLSGWLASAGLNVVHIAADSKYVAAEGSVVAMERAFSVDLNYYRGPKNLTLRSPSGDPSMPADLVDALPRVSVLGLDQHALTHKRKTKRRAAAVPASVGGRKLLSVVKTVAASGCAWSDASTSNPPLHGGVDNNTGMDVGCSYTAHQVRHPSPSQTDAPRL